MMRARTAGVPWRAILVSALVLAGGLGGEDRASAAAAPTLVVTQVPVPSKRGAALAGGTLRAPWGEGARIVRVSPAGAVTVLTAGFESAADPEVSFDGRRILFAGRRDAGSRWCVWEMASDGSGVRQVVCAPGDARSPVYLPTIYTLTPTSTESSDEIAFVAVDPDEENEYGAGPNTSLYACKVDGSSLHRLTFNLSNDADPFVLGDGRMLFSSWMRHSLEHGLQGRVPLLGMNVDGTDAQTFSGDQGLRVKAMPMETSDRRVVFVEADAVQGDGSGSLGEVSLRRNLHTYRRVTGDADGFFHSPSPLPDAGVALVSWRPADGSGSHGVYRLDLATGRRQRVFDDPGRDDVQAKVLAARRRPDARSSVVKDDDATGTLFALDVGINDLDAAWFPPGTARALRVLEGRPRRAGAPAVPPLAARRLLGEVPLADDGSFQVRVPADTPLQIQILDADGLALRASAWVWVRRHANQGCVGCHEDPERTPPNRFVKALESPAPALIPGPRERRVVDFRRDVMPILRARCIACHGEDGRAPRLDGAAEPDGGPNRAYRSLLAAYVVPGAARRSRVVWHVLGRNTSRPWDRDDWMKDVVRMPFEGEALSAEERRTLTEWIDAGALWDAGEEETR